MGRILIIEDEPAMRLLVQDYLEYLGYQVAPAPDGRTALDLAAAEEFALAFVDINLPDIQGDQVMRLLRERGSGTPMVVMSGNLRESYENQIADLKVSEILEKPVDLEDLERVVVGLLGKA